MRESKQKKLKEKLARIEESVTSKGHHMQDATTINTALIDIIAVIKELLNENSGEE